MVKLQVPMVKLPQNFLCPFFCAKLHLPPPLSFCSPPPLPVISDQSLNIAYFSWSNNSPITSVYPYLGSGNAMAVGRGELGGSSDLPPSPDPDPSHHPVFGSIWYLSIQNDKKGINHSFFFQLNFKRFHSHVSIKEGHW